MKIDIEDIIKEDLSAYWQGHEPELYVPIFIQGNPWRCYVFGDCFSLVAYNSSNWVYIRYIADDGGYTFYIDLVKGEFAKNSLSQVRYPIGDLTIDEMFNIILKNKS